MKRLLVIALISTALACTNEKPPESTYGSTDTIPSQTDTTLTSTTGPITATAPTETTNTEYGGTTATDTTTP
jgi:hypothetical protein